MGVMDELDPALAEALTSQVAVRAETDADFVAVENVVRRAFNEEEVVELVRRMRESPNYIPELSLVAEQNGQVVGQIMLSHVDLDDHGIRHTVLTLSPVAVAPEAQGHGIGGQLIETAVALADQQGEPLVVLEGSPKYYPRFGFQPASNFGISIDLPGWAAPEAAQVHSMSAYRPEIRGHVIYPPAFDVVSHDRGAS
jgi:putative acetyltransferase